MARHSPGAHRCRSALFPFWARQTFRARAPRTDAPNADRSARSFSGFQGSLCFNRTVCLGVLAYYWALDATGLGAARLRDGSGDCDDSNSQYQSVFVSGVARGISVSPRAALSGDSDLAILLRARMA